MDPFWLVAAEFWWIAPAAAGAGVLGTMGLRRRNIVNGRRLEYDAAREDLRLAQQHAAQSRMAVKVARAEHARVAAERAAARAAADAVSGARRVLRQAEQDAKAAAADVRLRRVRVNAARAAIPASSAPEHRPLARLRAAHDAVTARWMDYETDPAKLIAFPTMSDGRDPATGAFLTAADRAQWLRPTPEQKRITTAQFAAYRDAVAELERAFDVAERAARKRAGMPDPTEAANSGWQDAAQQMISRSADVWDRAAGAAASALAAWNARDRSEPRGEATGGETPPGRPGSAPTEADSRRGESDPPDAPRRPVWPVPRRDDS